MDKLEVRIIAFTGVIIGLFLVSLMYATGKRDIDVPACVPYSGVFENPQLVEIDDSTYQVFYVAQMWSFEPAQVSIPVGTELDIYLSAKDVVHGFHIEKKALNMMAVPGAIAKQTLRFDEPGVYRIVCHEFCGTGHQSMEGEIIVNYKTK